MNTKLLPMKNITSRTVRNSLIALALATSPHSLFAATLLSDNFAGSVGTQPAGWYGVGGAGGSSPLIATGAAALPGNVVQFTGTSGNSNFVAPFASTTLANTGDSITFTLNFQRIDSITATGPLIGLYYSNGTPITANHFSASPSPTANDLGYQTWKIMNTGTSDLKIAGTNAGAFNQYVGVDNTVSSGITATNTDAYSVTLTLARTALGLDITAGFGSYTAPAFSIAHANVLTYTFDQAVITGSSAITAGTSNFDNVVVTTTIPEPATWALLAFSLTTVMVLRRRRA